MQFAVQNLKGNILSRLGKTLNISSLKQNQTGNMSECCVISSGIWGIIISFWLHLSMTKEK